MKLLVVDDEPIALSSVRRLLKRKATADVDVCDNGPEAVDLIRRGRYDVVLLDLLMPEIDGLQLLTRVRSHSPATEFIMLTAVDDVAMAVRAIRMGAYDYLVKPVENERLVLTVRRAFERKGLRAGMAGGTAQNRAVPEAFADMVTRCAGMQKILSYAQTMAGSDLPILLTGETGTGKELMARGIHRASPMGDGPFMPVNVSAIPDTLFESQFFGHTRGAFTGAEQSRAGFFQQADGGTLFLDEIGEMSAQLQSKLLRTLEEGRVTPVGAREPIPFQVRIVSATNRDLEAACREGAFRLDLYYRINSVPIHLPTLEERDGDIALLADHFLSLQRCRQNGGRVEMSPEAMAVLAKRAYPGNIRELKQVVERAALMAEAGVIRPEHLGETTAFDPAHGRCLCSLQENAQMHIAYVLEQTRGDRKKAADILGVSVRHVQRKIAAMRRNSRWASLVRDI